MWSNALTYNPPGSDICIMATTLSEIFESRFEALKQKMEQKNSSMQTGMQKTIKNLASSLTAVQKELERIKTEKSPTGSGRKEDNRPMNFDEKKKLSLAINNLPSENLGMVVKIIHERMPHLTGSGEEIEIDIDSLDAPTLRHLERYVKSVSQRRSRRGSKAAITGGDSKVVQGAHGTKSKIEDVERRLKVCTVANFVGTNLIFSNF